MMTELLVSYLHKEVLGTALWSWMVLLLVAVLVYLLATILLSSAKRKLKRMADSREAEEKADPSKENEGAEHNKFRILYDVLRRTARPTLAAGALLVALLVVPGLNEKFQETARTFCVVLLILQVGIWGVAYLDAGLKRILAVFNIRETAAQTAMGVLRFFALILLWAGIVILILDNVGVRVGPLIAGLGIGGIAVAFALQKILADIFCSVAIVLDRPFEVGDFVIMGEVLGTIERIGIKTTRIRSLGGEQIIVSNADLTESRIRNYKRMPQRRVVFTFRVSFHTPPEVAEQIGGWVKEIVQAIEQTRFDRAHLKEFGDSFYTYEVVYYVLSPDYNLYMDIQQKINVALIRKFQAENVLIAYPTRILHVEKLPALEIEGGFGGLRPAGEA